MEKQQCEHGLWQCEPLRLQPVWESLNCTRVFPLQEPFSFCEGDGVHLLHDIFHVSKAQVLTLITHGETAVRTWALAAVVSKSGARRRGELVTPPSDRGVGP